jgi:photosystem II stability/assembly factor-like uncharacterized protein
MYKVQFLRTTEGWVLEGSHLIQTTDAGSTWREHRFEHVIIRSFHFADSTHGWFVGESLRLPSRERDVESWHPVIYGTDDGGSTWRCLFTGKANRYPLWDVCAVSTREIWAVGALILHSGNGGVTWERIKIDNWGRAAGIPYMVRFSSPEIGWIMTNEAGGYLFTNDAGRTWVVRPSSVEPRWITDIVYVSPTEAWGLSEGIYRSTDTGKTWTRSTEGKYSKLQYLTDEGMLIAVGSGRLVRYQIRH